MILGLLLLAAALVVYFELILSAYGSAESVKAEMLGLQSFLGGQKPVIGRIQELISAYQSQGRLEEAISLALPAKQDSAGALAQIYGLSQSSDLDLLSATLSVTAVENLSRARSGETVSLRASIQKPVGTTVVRMRLGGPYEGLKSFIERLETNIRIFNVRSLTIQPILTAQRSTQNLFTYDLEVAAYHQAK